MIHAASKQFIAQNSGVIINVIANVFRGFPTMAHTGAARAGVDNLTKTLAVEWARFNIRVNAVAPGIIESSVSVFYSVRFAGLAVMVVVIVSVVAIDVVVSRSQGTLEPGRYGDGMLAQAAEKVIPMGRVGSVREVTDCVLFLASEGASFVTGQTLYIDGAQSLGKDMLGMSGGFLPAKL